MNLRFWKRSLLFLLLILSVVTVLALIFYNQVIATPPQVPDLSVLQDKRQETAPQFYTLKHNWLKKNQAGFWELYLEGAPFERGVYGGKLCRDILEAHESAFVQGVEEKIHSRWYLQVLKLFVAWFNRDLPDHVPLEYQQEIYGWSLSASDSFDYVGPKYHRKLNYHAAHDIGHALQNMGLVSGCTALAAWDGASADSTLLIGRNFDFYVGDGFARHKMIAFIKPDSGIPFAMVTWPGMVGTVSGMNLEGLTVTLNAGPSGIPKGAKTPVTILARRILQYASTIEEAFRIAEETETFVSENFVVSSGKSRRVVVIEKTPEQTILYESGSEHLVCANHFQDSVLWLSEENEKALRQTSTAYRHRRMEQLFTQNQPLTPAKMAAILHDYRGMDNRFIGLGNEMAIDQLIAHHSVIFQPEKLMMWVAGMPSQLGPFVAYDLEEVFRAAPALQSPLVIADAALSLPADSLFSSPGYSDYLQYKQLAENIAKATKQANKLEEEQLHTFERLNPEHYRTYELLGDYYRAMGNCAKALTFYQKGLTKAIPWLKDREHLEEGKKRCM
jgi:isopenicillin-N N-acyltransferase-like protein